MGANLRRTIERKRAVARSLIPGFGPLPCGGIPIGAIQKALNHSPQCRSDYLRNTPHGAGCPNEWGIRRGKSRYQIGISSSERSSPFAACTSHAPRWNRSCTRISVAQRYGAKIQRLSSIPILRSPVFCQKTLWKTCSVVSLTALEHRPLRDQQSIEWGSRLPCISLRQADIAEQTGIPPDQ